jgi:hypothetical protein
VTGIKYVTHPPFRKCLGQDQNDITNTCVKNETGGEWKNVSGTWKYVPKDTGGGNAINPLPGDGGGVVTTADCDVITTASTTSGFTTWATQLNAGQSATGACTTSGYTEFIAVTSLECPDCTHPNPATALNAKISRNRVEDTIQEEEADSKRENRVLNKSIIEYSVHSSKSDITVHYATYPPVRKCLSKDQHQITNPCVKAQ